MANPPKSLDAPEARALRDVLVTSIEQRGCPWPGAEWDQAVLDVIRRVPRHVFAPKVDLDAVYLDVPQPIGFGQTISQPTVVALMTQALELSPRHRVLEIGCGSGYQSAVLARCAAQVFSIELVAELAETARAHLASLGVDNVHVRHGDGYLGWPAEAPFDRILLTAAPPALPQTLIDQLGDDGILVAPVGAENHLQRLVRLRKRGSVITREDLGGVLFVPMVTLGDRLT